MSQAQRDQAAEAAAKSAVVRLFGKNAIDRIEVFPAEDHTGEQSLSVTIYLRDYKAYVSGARLLDTIVAVSDALRNIDDLRFPYVTFLAPGYEHAEDDERPAA
ncbi:hypothetical protein DFR50_12741 [Roseiarcus fermentans]|uniref:Uncharacterized protein n=2 Tax=Roseiarcus fermentans TaxID=1473586 RepID=A0A366EZT3_9HYPH|nr:hypothetical protein DFR50_12741 [Roseiarcus fermentans]